MTLQMTNNGILEMNIKYMFSKSGKYIIPVYQRNYAWGEAEITQLIQDILDSLKSHRTNYFLGTLVVYEREENGLSTYETIDGQQRLTTLSILLSVLKNDWQKELKVDMDWLDELNLDFKSRKASSTLLNQLFMYGSLEGLDYKKGSNIAAAYELTTKQLKKLLEEEEVEIITFTKYLLENVRILRVPVPPDTDLNHYFEIMNTRGEQLEKHEIVKSKLLNVFSILPEAERNDLSYTFNSVWNATSDMERYLQYGFGTKERTALFGKEEWGHLKVKNFDELNRNIGGRAKNGNKSEALSIQDIISSASKSKSTEEADDAPIRFYAVINFENFLLHVLRLMKGVSKDIPLDDKRLISIFDEELKNVDNKTEFVKEFCYQLFRTKFFFDKYIIKREFIGGKDHWSLKRLKRYQGSNVSYVNTFGTEEDQSSKGTNRKLLMLLSMFHVSTPTMVYKHWLSASLKFPFENAQMNGTINAQDYIVYLEKVAKMFVFGRHLRSENSLEYHQMIFLDNEISDLSWSKVDEEKMTFGNISNNLVFNYIDYLYWIEPDTNDEKINNYEFSYRSSVEHYYPQNPLEGGVKKLSTPEELKALNCIGNLCLISHSKNSRLSNFSPLQKIEFYNKNIDSIKQYKMMQNGENWDVSAINAHDIEVKDLLKKELL